MPVCDQPSPQNAISRRRRQGFAITVALVLVAFVFLVLMALSTFMQVETRVAASQATTVQARQNALFALSMALGELQRQTGPDQRVTAKADIEIPEEVDITSSISGSAMREQLNDYWNANRNRHWTGVWHNSNTSSFSPSSPSNSNATPELLNWLVSGANTLDDLEPWDAISGMHISNPQNAITDARGRAHRVLVSPSLVSSDTDGSRTVTAPQVTLSNTEGATIGNYAWWVGDEGVKARANLVDPYADDLSEVAQLRRIASAQRTAMEAMTTDGTDGLAAFSAANNSTLHRIFNLSQFSFINPSETYADEINHRFHDLTVHSSGVLADVKNGGLKRDLSFILGQPDIESLHDAVNAAFGDTVIGVSGANNRVLIEEVTPMARIPGNIPNTKGDHDLILNFTPTWEMLWSFHNMGNDVDASPPGVYNDEGEVVPMRITPTQHGIHPMVVQAKLYYGLRFAGSQITVDVYPLVVLANPYGVPLGPADYTFRFSNPSPQLRFGSDDPEVESPKDIKDEHGAVIGQTLGNFHSTAHSMPRGGLGETQLILRSEGMEPGEAQIFTLEVSGQTIPDTVQQQRNFQLIMVNDFDPDAHVSYQTGESIPEDFTHAALRVQANLSVKLYLDYDPAVGHVEGDIKLIHQLSSQMPSSASNEYGDLAVYPINGGSRRGGGVAMTMYDHQFHQRNLFLQQNYRMNVGDGFHGWTGPTHLLQPARTHAKNGSPGNEEYYKAHLLMPEPGNFTNVRWGPINTGHGNMNTVPPNELVGTAVGVQNILYDIPSRAIPLSSLGQLQHFNVSAYIERSNWSSGDSNRVGTTIQAWQNNYSLSNSYAHYLVQRDRLYDGGDAGYHYDGSYIWNNILWDKFYFSSLPATGDFDFGSDNLVNTRYRPFRNPDEVPLNDMSQFRGSAEDQASSRLAARNLISEGAFNINSTSVDAWKAVFSSLRNIPIGSETNTANLSAPFVRTLRQTEGSQGATSMTSVNSWTGFRNLTQDEVNTFAEEMVKQVQLRGPFTSMSDFVNRKLVSRSNDPHGLGLKGALQAAIDAFTNATEEVDSIFRIVPTYNANLYKDHDHLPSSIMSGAPGYLLQGDILSSLGQHMTARSDTFVIRTYGDVTNPVNGSVEAQVWGEAVVQRLPDYINEAEQAYDDAVLPENIDLGRRYKVVAFRWLNSDEI